MLADAADEVLLVVRAHDTQSLDPANMSELLSVFENNVTRLFIKGHCCDHGYTANVLGHLSGVHVHLISGKEPMSIDGNVTDNMRSR